jgi:hypothetical protein
MGKKTKVTELVRVHFRLGNAMLASVVFKLKNVRNVIGYNELAQLKIVL